MTNLAFAGSGDGRRQRTVSDSDNLRDNLAQGFTGTVFIAYLSSLTNVSYTATQYALFTSIMVLPGKLLSGYSGVIVDAIGWVSFFGYAA